MPKQTRSLLDLMPEDKRKKALENAEKRLERNRSKKGLDVSPEFYMAAEMGYYFGWDGIMALRRGYTVEPVTGEKELFSTVEAQLLLEGAKKVWYGKLVEQAHAGLISNTFNISGKTFEQAIQPFIEKMMKEE